MTTPPRPPRTSAEGAAVDEAWEAAFDEIRRRVGDMDSVSVAWAPAHTAPYVSQLIIAPIVEATLSRHRPVIEAAVWAAGSELDSAWAAAEAALPEGWRGPTVGTAYTTVAKIVSIDYAASAWNYARPHQSKEASGPTPAAALQAIALALGGHDDTPD